MAYGSKKKSGGRHQMFGLKIQTKIYRILGGLRVMTAQSIPYKTTCAWCIGNQTAYLNKVVMASNGVNVTNLIWNVIPNI